MTEQPYKIRFVDDFGVEGWDYASPVDRLTGGSVFSGPLARYRAVEVMKRDGVRLVELVPVMKDKTGRWVR